MSSKVYVLGATATPFGRWPDKGFRDLSEEATLGAIEDAGLEDGTAIDAIWFGNCLMSYWGQEVTKGTACLAPMVRAGVINDSAPIVNVEGGCATGSLALAGAYKEIKAGDADLTLALGVEKLYEADRSKGILDRFDGGTAPIDGDELRAYYKEVGEHVGKPFETGPERSFAMDTYAMQALVHQHHFGTTTEQIAYVAAKNHNNGSLNPRAQYQFQMTAEEVLADRLISEPLTRAMCAPLGDGAAAVLLCSAAFLEAQPEAVRRRAVPILGLALSGGKYRDYEEPSLSRVAADKAYAMADVTPADVDLVELHDATAFCEIFQTEMLRLAPRGKGGEYAASGATQLGGAVPVNTSGGLISKGHPLGATGTSMCFELVTQLRGEGGKRQVEDAQIALQENGGGILGLGEAVAAVVIYGRPDAS